MAELTRVQLRWKVNQFRRVAKIRNITLPPLKLNTTNVEIRKWIEKEGIFLNRRNIQFAELSELTLKKQRAFKLNQRIENSNFKTIFSMIKLNDIYKLTNIQADKVINKMLNVEGQYIIELNGSDFPANGNNIAFIKNILMNGYTAVEEDGYGSDRQKNILLEGIRTVDVKFVPPGGRVAPDQNGGYFKYINTTGIDLNRYQIYQLPSSNLYNCLVNSLSLYESISEDELNSVMLSIVAGSSISKKHLLTVANILKKKIILHTIDKRGGDETSKYGNYDDKIDLCLYKEHYFIFEKTIYTGYSIKNYELVRNEPDFQNIYEAGRRSLTKPRINSLQLVKILFEAGYFIPGIMTNEYKEGNEEKKEKNKYYLDGDLDQKPIDVKEIKKNTKDIFYADFESYVYKQPHTMFLLGVVSDKSDDVEIMNINDFTEPKFMIWKFLKFMTNNGKNDVLCYFHNLKYDYHLMEKYLNISQVCQKDGQLFNVLCYYKGVKVEFRDSYKLAPMALSEFSNSFKLEGFSKLEATNYTYYKPENNNKTINKEEYSAGLSVKDKIIFDKTIKTKKFSPTSYYIKYLKMDCLVLKKGLQKFNQIITEITENKIEIYDVLTISSLADKYMLINGAYDGVYKNSGNLRDYISKAVYGGRVHVNELYQKKEINEKIADYDGVSLYPSAIERLCRETGLPMGMCKRIRNPANFWVDKEYDYAILTVKINKVNKKQQMPFIAVKTDESINYTNECPSEPLIIDNITLQDYIKFHEIEFTILDGVYWNEGYNPIMGQLITNLFKVRMENKRSNPAMANILKLILNSSYGKTIMKKTNTKTRIIKNDLCSQDEETKEWIREKSEKYNQYIYKNFNTIKSSRKINDNMTEIDEICVDESYNRGHIGCYILSMSKRIMNEVFDTANTIKAPIYYQDTDSCHMNLEDVPRLEEEFYNTYGRELTGPNLGQFHVDFSMNGAVGDIHATRSIFLGKKSYIDQLEGVDKDGNIITDYHIRLKGITKESIEYHSKEYDSPFELFKYLADGGKKNMILNPFNIEDNKQKAMFNYKNGAVSTLESGSFTREIKF